jgi:hypothetical protein
MIFRRIYDAADEALTGRKILYHGTAERNLPSIYKEGLRGSYTDKPGALTKRFIRDMDAPKYKFKNLVYTVDAHDKSYADAFGDKRLKKFNRKAKRDSRLKDHAVEGKTLRIAIPKSELAKLKRVANPEYEAAAKHAGSNEELAKYYTGKSYKDLNPVDRREIRRSRKFLKHQTNHHYIIRGDIDAKYIKGSGTYRPHRVFGLKIK